MNTNVNSFQLQVNMHTNTVHTAERVCSAIPVVQTENGSVLSGRYLNCKTTRRAGKYRSTAFVRGYIGFVLVAAT